MKTPKVSIIMPAYNTEKYIGEAIESILNQTFQDFEFIILNDGSTDKTPEIIEAYAKKDKRIKFINNKKNQGFIASLNECLDVAKGEYIAKMDSDDISLPERIKKQVEYLDAHPEAGMVGCGYQIFDKEDVVRIFSSHIKFFDLYIGCQVSIVMFRKTIIDNNKLRFRSEYLHAEDYDFYSRFIRYGEIHNLQEVLYHYRWHGNNVSFKYLDIQLKNSDKIRQNMLDFLTDDPALQQKILEIINPAQTKSITKYYLFNLIPFLKIKKKGNKTKYYLFSFIPILKRKEK